METAKTTNQKGQIMDKEKKKKMIIEILSKRTTNTKSKEFGGISEVVLSNEFNEIATEIVGLDFADVIPRFSLSDDEIDRLSNEYSDDPYERISFKSGLWRYRSEIILKRANIGI